MSGAPYERKRVVGDRDLDGYGHVNNAVWVRFVVELAAAHAQDRGFGEAATRAAGGVWIVRRHEIDYHRSAVLGDELVESTWVESMKGARSLRCSRITRASDGALLLEARTEWAFVDPDGQRPRRIPPELQRAFLA